MALIDFGEGEWVELWPFLRWRAQQAAPLRTEKTKRAQSFGIGDINLERTTAHG